MEFELTPTCTKPAPLPFLVKVSSTQVRSGGLLTAVLLSLLLEFVILRELKRILEIGDNANAFGGVIYGVIRLTFRIRRGEKSVLWNRDNRDITSMQLGVNRDMFQCLGLLVLG